MFSNYSIPVMIITIGIVFLVFLILREFWCWYMKQNKIISLLEKILEELKTKNIVPPKAIKEEIQKKEEA
jgi:hypothetical protein